jgi:hypothetical protein
MSGEELFPDRSEKSDNTHASSATTDTSLEGSEFDSASGVWRLSDRSEMDVEQVRPLFASELQAGLNGTLRHLARTKSPSTCKFAVQALCDYARRISPDAPIAAWRTVDLANYREHLKAEFGHEQYMTKLRAFLKAWYALRFPGPTAEVIDALTAMRIKELERGRAIRRMEPDDGPLDIAEMHGLTRDLYVAYERRKISHDRFATSLFHIVTGRRPRQSADLKCRDLNDELRLLTIPRAKQSGGTFRSAFRSVELTDVYFAVFRHQKALVRERFTLLLADLGFDLQSQDLDALAADLPLFPAWRRAMPSFLETAEIAKGGQHGRALQMLRDYANGARWHRKSQSVLEELQTAAAVAGTLSREGKPLIVDGRRFRHTKGTDLARAGAGPEIIAWVLDHSLLASCRTYIDNLPEHAIPANAAMARSPVMLNVAQMFRGQLVDNEADAVGGHDQRNRIHHKGQATATCGGGKRCGLNDGIPRACYTCEDFQPWLEGPHEALLGDILVEREHDASQLGADHPVTKRSDKTIIAIINVIQRCEVRREERNTGVSSTGGEARQ